MPRGAGNGPNVITPFGWSSAATSSVWPISGGPIVPFGGFSRLNTIALVHRFAVIEKPCANAGWNCSRPIWRACAAPSSCGDLPKMPPSVPTIDDHAPFESTAMSPTGENETFGGWIGVNHALTT